MGVHRVYIETGIGVGEVVVSGEEAHHAARVKRLEIGERVEILDGRGGVGRGEVMGIRKVREGWELDVRVGEVVRVEPESPRVEVCSAVPKGARLSELIDGLAQVGAAMWRPLTTERGGGEGVRREKMERVAVEASKQSGRAWRMEIGEAIDVEKAAAGMAGWDVVLADGSGERYVAESERVRLLIGPEGGWTEREMKVAREAGARVCRFGVHTMRIETAAVVAAGVIVNA